MIEGKDCCNEMAAVLNAGMSLGPVQTVTMPRMQYAIVPEGATLKSLKEFADTPARCAGHVNVDDVQSLLDYWEQFSSGSSIIFADYDKKKIVTVLDYHASSFAPGWKDHTCTFSLQQTMEWRRWTGKDKKAMSQVEFATFIEDNLIDIIEPDSATILEVSRNLVAKKKVEFASAIRLDNGAHVFAYNEEIKGTTAKGQIEIPEEFIIGISPYRGFDAYKIKARLRYRIHDNGQLLMWFDLLNPEKVEEDVFTTAVGMVREKTNRPVLLGSF